MVSRSGQAQPGSRGVMPSTIEVLKSPPPSTDEKSPPAWQVSRPAFLIYPSSLLKSGFDGCDGRMKINNQENAAFRTIER